MKNKILNSPVFRVAVAIIAALAIIYGACTVSNTFQAYEIVSSNYDTFNYPNTIKVHSGTFKQTEMMDLFVCKVSAENAYGQRSYNSFLASKDGMTSFEWYDENDIPILSSTKKQANQSNISELLLNFLIWKDWV